jgi:hypothetical protein
MEIIKRFRKANKTWRLNYTFFSLPLPVCIEAYIRTLFKEVE